MTQVRTHGAPGCLGGARIGNHREKVCTMIIAAPQCWQTNVGFEAAPSCLRSVLCLPEQVPLVETMAFNNLRERARLSRRLPLDKSP